ncbi:SLS1 [Candida oxycetoniae]|uniref:SLS1 n=1 Tax=Candida oxycetoniae TaxID=497107 RepID=A0AAI9SYL9_9ASCO|nr:SLS1 [Candida oxycetoniae]KAI3405191.2 SLS1 [Candida oxycetoniae]
MSFSRKLKIDEILAPIPTPTNVKSKRLFLSPSDIEKRKKSYQKKRTTTRNDSKSPLKRQSQGHGLKTQERPRVDPLLFTKLFPTYESKLSTRTNNKKEAEVKTKQEEEEEEEEIFSYLESFKPFESVIGVARFENIAKSLDKAFKKRQLAEYINYLKKKFPEKKKLTKNLTKPQLIQSIISEGWNITKSSKLGGGQVMSTKVFGLTPVIQFLLKQKRSQFLQNLVSSKLQTKLIGSNLIVSGLTSKLTFLEAEFAHLADNIQTKILDLSQLKPFYNLENIDLESICETSSVFIEKTDDDKLVLSASFQDDINLAKRLISWSISEQNRHIKTNIYNKNVFLKASYVPFLNNEVWTWSEKDFQYYSIFKNDERPGRYNDIIFEKFDKMNDIFLESKSLEELSNSRLSFKLESSRSLDEGLKFLNRDISNANAHAILENEGPKEDSKIKDVIAAFDWKKLLSNQSASPLLKSEKEKHESLEELRHHLGSFTESNFDIDEFPDVSKLVEDVEKKSNDQVVDDLRKELGAFSSDSSSEVSMFDELLEGVDTVTSNEANTNDYGCLREGTQENNNTDIDDNIRIEGNNNNNDIDDNIRMEENNNNNDINDKLIFPEISSLKESEIDEFYDQLNLDGKSEDPLLFQTYTLQFGSILLQERKSNTKIFQIPSSPTVTKESQFKFLTNVPFIKDIASSLPILFDKNQAFTNKFQIRLIPSIYQDSNNLNSKQIANYPPIEIQANLNSWGKIDLDTLEILSIETMNNICIPLHHLPCDIQISKTSISNKLPLPSKSEHEQPDSVDLSTRFSSQPDLANFLEKSSLHFTGKDKVHIEPSIELIVDNKLVKYDFVHLTYRTDLSFDFRGREVCLSLLEGGEFGGRRFEVIMGEGKLTKEEFGKFVKDGIRFISLIK